VVAKRPLLVTVAAALAAAVAGAATLFDAGVEPSASAADATAPGLVTGLRAGLTDEVTKPAGQGLVEWSASWQLTWEPVPGAVEYVVHAVGPEGEAPSADALPSLSRADPDGRCRHHHESRSAGRVEGASRDIRATQLA
jgi:hypothetical protein